MHSLLTGDERIALGMERYGSYLGADFSAGLFTKERFFNFDTDPRDKNRKSAKYLEAVENKFDTATYIGDKIPLLYLAHETVSQIFPHAKYIVILRNIFDICNSYKERKQNPNDNWALDVVDAVRHWNQLLKFLNEKKNDPQIHSILYEDFFTDVVEYRNLYKFLELDFDDACEERYVALIAKTKVLEDRRNTLLDDRQKLFIFKNADIENYKSILTGDLQEHGLRPPSPSSDSASPSVIQLQDVLSAARIFFGEAELSGSEVGYLVGCNSTEILKFFLKSKKFQDNNFNRELILKMTKALGIEAER
jgi:hypothetical protein